MGSETLVMELRDGRWKLRRDDRAHYHWKAYQEHANSRSYYAPYTSLHGQGGATGYDPDLMENLRRIVDTFNEQSRSRP